MNFLTRINFSAVTDAQNEYHQSIMLQRTDEAIVSDTVFPELAQCRSQAFADLTRVIELGNSFVQKLRDPAGDGLVETVEFFLSGWIELNRPFWV